MRRVHMTGAGRITTDVGRAAVPSVVLFSCGRSVFFVFVSSSVGRVQDGFRAQVQETGARRVQDRRRADAGRVQDGFRDVQRLIVILDCARPHYKRPPLCNRPVILHPSLLSDHPDPPPGPVECQSRAPLHSNPTATPCRITARRANRPHRTLHATIYISQT